MQKVGSQVSNFLLKLILGIFVLTSTVVYPQIATAATSSSSAQTIRTEIIAAGTKYATELYVIESGVPGPVVMIVGGVHGNETAGYKAAGQIKDYTIKKGTLLVLPQANKRAVAAHTRTVGGDDLNRNFPTTKSGQASGTLAKAILSTMKKYNVDWVMDMHEGINYSRSSSSDGQSLVYYPNSQTKTIASSIVSTLNKKTSGTSKDFELRQYPIKGSLARAAAVCCGAHSFIFESCSKESLSTRVNNQLTAANMLLDYLDMK